MWYQLGSRRDKECDLFEPLFKTPSNKNAKNSFNVKPLLIMFFFINLKNYTNQNIFKM